MKYTILSSKVVEDHVFTEVLFEFPDAKSVTESVGHFQPKSDTEVYASLENRYVSEEVKKDASIVCEEVSQSLKLNTPLPPPPDPK